MKVIKANRVFLLLFFIGVLMMSCTKVNESKLVTGYWSSNFMELESIDGGKSEIETDYSTYFDLDVDGTYYKNYEVGNWSVKNNKLELVPNDDLIASYSYKIVRCTSNNLVLKRVTYVSGLNWSFETFSPADKVEVTEIYER